MTAALVIAPAPRPVDRPVDRSVDPARGAVTAETYRRRRLAVVAVLAGLVLGLASFGRSADATPTAEARAASAITVVVDPGDTLWGIARELAPDADPRPLVAELAELAGGTALQPGQVLVVPGALVG